MFVRVHVQISNETTVGAFSNFNLLHGCCMLVPFLPLLRHYALLVLTIWRGCYLVALLTSNVLRRIVYMSVMVCAVGSVT